MTNLNPPPTQIWGRTDYFPIPGLHSTCLLAAGMPAGYIAAVGEGKDSGTITGWPITNKIRIASVLDGTSNTLMVSECGSKPIGYNGFRQIYKSEVDGLPVDGVIEPVSSAGGAWADNFTYSSLAGARAAKTASAAARAWSTARATTRSIRSTQAGPTACSWTGRSISSRTSRRCSLSPPW